MNCLTSNVFDLTWSNEKLSQEKGIVLIYLGFNENAFRSLNYASQPVHFRSGKNMKTVINYFFDIPVEKCDGSVSEETLNPELLLSSIQNCYQPDKSSSVSHELLIPELRPYQSQAVDWMLNCEKSSNSLNQLEIHDLYCEFKSKNGPSIYFHKYGGFFVKEKYRPVPRSKGGILCDEMGLGKTVEVIACILLNPRPSMIVESASKESLDQNRKVEKYEAANHSFECICGSNYSEDIDETIQCSKCGLLQHPGCILNNPLTAWDDYVCPYCLVNDPNKILKSRATLIVSPSVILHQWEEEINKHVKEGGVKVYVYLGVNQQKFIHPSVLADNDIVVTAYEVFKSEINYLNLPHGDNQRALRNPQKYRCIPSPLLSIEWWRICLDEAQMVENVSAKVSQLAWQLHSINRWCITGTPIQKSFQDLYGLLLFLGYDPFNEKIWWQELLWKPFMNGCSDTLKAVLNQVLWRTKKTQVMEQIGIPPVETVVHNLQFSIVEKIFYENSREYRLNEFRQCVAEFGCQDDKIDFMDKRLFFKLLVPLKKLQLCCDWFGSPDEKRVTIPELHDHLIRTSRLDCEECHRQLIAALNGVAGLNSIQKNFEEASNAYTKALQSIEDNKTNIKTDKLQQIHILYNYSKLIKQGPICLDEDSNDGTFHEAINVYEVKCDELVNSYLEKYRFSAQKAFQHFTDYVKKVNKIESQCKFDWWWNLVKTLKGEEEQSTFIRNLKIFLSDVIGNSVHNSIVYRFSNPLGLQYCIVTALDYLLDVHKELITSLKKVCTPPVSEDFAPCRDCHLRPEKNVERRKICQLCQVDRKFKEYESKLFRFEEYCSEDEEQDDKGVCFQRIRKGTHANSDLELTFKFIIAYFKNNSVNCRHIEDGCKVYELFLTLRKEFKAARNSWLLQNDYINALDEVDMAKTSMQLCSDETDLSSKNSDPNKLYLVTTSQMPSMLLQFKSDAITYEKSFKHKLGRLFYLNNLKKADDMENKPFDETCPVCNEALKNAWSVLQCGHSFCCHCISIIMSQVLTEDSDLHCAVCREVTHVKEVYYVDPEKMKRIKESIEVKGRYSTKITAVTKCILEIKKNDPFAKSIVFSGSVDLLYTIQDAFTANHINYCCVADKSELKKNLAEYKLSEDLNVLVMPLQLGANGLNITEASHVLFIEPPMIKSVKLQGIGRLHRFGQDKKITVHEFFIEGTIQEKIYHMNRDAILEDQGECSAKSNLTVNDLLTILG
nr:E3 ubiquitin-protein ligase SHPRH [Parasteatoda tepidariorum]